VSPLYNLNCELVRWVPPNDKFLRSARVHGYIGGAECLWAMGRIDEALAAAQAIDTSSLSADELQGVAWVRGITLYSKGQFAQAAVQFEKPTGNPKFKYAESLNRLLIVSLARAGQTEEADHDFDDWVRRYHPSVEVAASILDKMGLGTQ